MAANDNIPDDWRTAREIANPDDEYADTIRMCEDCGRWALHKMESDGSYSCVPCEEEASDEEVREAVQDFEEER